MGAIVVLASCGGGSDSTSEDTVSNPSESAVETDTPDAVSQGGVVTVAGTEYVFLAGLQCGIYASAGQYYISGSLPEVEGGFLSYSRDDDIHEIGVELGEDRYVFVNDDEIESTIDGNVVTGTATLSSELGGDKVAVVFRFEC